MDNISNTTENEKQFKDLTITYEEFVAMFELLYNIVINTPSMPRHTVVWIKNLADKLGFIPRDINMSQNAKPNVPESHITPQINAEYMKAMEKLKNTKRNE